MLDLFPGLTQLCLPVLLSIVKLECDLLQPALHLLDSLLVSDQDLTCLFILNFTLLLHLSLSLIKLLSQTHILRFHAF